MITGEWNALHINIQNKYVPFASWKVHGSIGFLQVLTTLNILFSPHVRLQNFRIGMCIVNAILSHPHIKAESGMILYLNVPGGHVIPFLHCCGIGFP